MDDDLFSTTKKPARLFNARLGTYPTDAVWIDRRSPWGNPFRSADHPDLSRDQIIDLFDEEVLPTLDVSSLRGRDLICWCKPKRCHGDGILRKANS
jgi:hypothetical protein